MSTEETQSLSLDDLKTIQTIIQLATKRGTWEVDELTTVGSIYEKLTSFLIAVEHAQVVDTAQSTETESLIEATNEPSEDDTINGEKNA